MLLQADQSIRLQYSNQIKLYEYTNRSVEEYKSFYIIHLYYGKM